MTPGLEEGSENVLPEGPEAEAGRDEKNQRHDFIASEQQEGTKVSPQRQGITIAKHAVAYPTFSQKATMRSHSPVPW